jgi:hypothetical protein
MLLIASSGEKEAQEKLIKEQVEKNEKKKQDQNFNESVSTTEVDNGKSSVGSGPTEADGEEQQVPKKCTTIFDMMTHATPASWMDSWKELSVDSEAKETTSTEVSTLELKKQQQGSFRRSRDVFFLPN